MIKHLGRLPTREHADMVARQMGLLCSVLKCGRRGTVERSNTEPMRVKLCAQHAAASEGGETLLVYPLF